MLSGSETNLAATGVKLHTASDETPAMRLPRVCLTAPDTPFVALPPRISDERFRR
jgi:hypothetical protein